MIVQLTRLAGNWQRNLAAAGSPVSAPPVETVRPETAGISVSDYCRWV